VLDYPEYATETGLNLQCTPGNDVEWRDRSSRRWANIVLFTTGLGNPTGNPIAPVVKLSTNSAAGPTDAGTSSTSIQADYFRKENHRTDGKRVLEFVIQVVNGKSAQRRSQSPQRRVPFRERRSSLTLNAAAFVRFPVTPESRTPEPLLPSVSMVFFPEIIPPVRCR